MCEFKVLKLDDSSEIAEEILAMGYSNDNQLFLSDIMGVRKAIDSALIWDVNTMTQTVKIIEHPIISEFLTLMRKIISKDIQTSDIENFKNKLDGLIKQ